MNPDGNAMKEVSDIRLLIPMTKIEQLFCIQSLKRYWKISKKQWNAYWLDQFNVKSACSLSRVKRNQLIDQLIGWADI